MPRELVEMQVYTPTSEAWKSRIWSCILVLYSLVFSSITVYLSLNTAMITSEGEAGDAMMMMGTEDQYLFTINWSNWSLVSSN